MRLTENLYDLLKKSRKLQIYCCKRSRCCLEDDLPIYINWVAERHIISISDWRHLPWANFINIHNISAKQKSIFFCLKIRSKYKNQLENSILYYSFRTKNIRAHINELIALRYSSHIKKMYTPNTSRQMTTYNKIT